MIAPWVVSLVITNASAVLDRPLDDCIKQLYPVSAAELEALIPEAAARTHLSAQRAQSHGKPVWLLDVGMTLVQAGESVRVFAEPVSDVSSRLCYLGVRKNLHDVHEQPMRIWSHYNAWVAALAFDVWVKKQ